MLFRSGIIKDPYFRQVQAELFKNNFLFSHKIFWSIYSVFNTCPYVCHFDNGLKAVFVAFKKDSTVGKDVHAPFMHRSEERRVGIECRL